MLTEGESDGTIAAYIVEALGLKETAFAAAVTKGASARPDPALLREVAAKGFRAVLLVPDADEPGQRWAQAWTEAARQAGLLAQSLNLVSKGLVFPSLGETDLRDAFRRQGVRVMAALKEAIVALAAQASQGPTFPQTNMYAVGGKVLNAAAILASPTAESLESLPLLGQQGVVIKGWGHLFAAPPKCGKTELVWACAQEWDAQGLRVLWVTEETESVWARRLRRDNASPTHVRWLMAAGMRAEDILAAIREVASTFDVVIVDTLRHLFQVDEGDNATIARTISSLDEAIGRNKTRIYLHHTRKAPGQHGERTAGGLAFVGGVDRQLELSWDEHHDSRRLLKGVSRICPVPEVLLAWEEGRLKVLGHPRAVELARVRERVLAVLDWEWRSTAQVIDSLGEPRPSDQQVRAALKSLAQEGLVERQPPIDEGDRPGCRYLWRLAPDLSSNGEDISLREGPGPQAQGAPAPPTDPLAQALAEAFEPEEDEQRAQEETHPSRQPEDPPPLPGNIRFLCPRCANESELLNTKAQCLSCLLVFTPPRIADWALRVFQESDTKTPDMWGENPGQNPGQNSGQNLGQNLGQNSGHRETLDTETPDKRAKNSGQKPPDKTSDTGGQNSGHGETPDTKTPDIKTSDTKTSDKGKGTPDKGKPRTAWARAVADLWRSPGEGPHPSGVEITVASAARGPKEGPPKVWGVRRWA
jgi:hypothetical protein